MGLIAKIFVLVGSTLVLLGGMGDRAMVDVEDVECETGLLGFVNGRIRLTFPAQGFRAGPDHVIAALVLEPGHWVEGDPSWLTVSVDCHQGEGPVVVATHTDADDYAADRLATALEAAGYWERPGDWVPGDFPSPDDQGLFFVQSQSSLITWGTIDVFFEFTVDHDDSVPFTFPRLIFGAGGVADINQAPPGSPYPVLLVDEPVGQRIPTVSTWGLIIVALMLLVAAKICFGRRRAAIVVS